MIKLMTSLESILEPILHSPRLPEAVELLTQKIEAEKALRKKFYEEMTPSQKVEFIDGEVVLHSPARNEHLDATGLLFRVMGAFVDSKDLGTVKSEKCLCVFPRNDYEPDIVFFGPGKSGQLNRKTLKFPVPDLAVEVLSDSTEKNDRGVKFEDFAANGVDEYWIIDAEARRVEQYRLDSQTGDYTKVFDANEGAIDCQTIPGFSIPVSSIFDEKENLATLKRLI